MGSRQIEKNFGDFGTLFIEGISQRKIRKGLPADNGWTVDSGLPPFQVDIPAPPNPDVHGFSPESDIFFQLRELSDAIGYVCAAGGSAKIILLLKTWVEERKGRSIRIKKGEVELEIKGGVSEEKIETTIQLFAEYFQDKT